VESVAFQLYLFALLTGFHLACICVNLSFTVHIIKHQHLNHMFNWIFRLSDIPVVDHSSNAHQHRLVFVVGLTEAVMQQQVPVRSSTIRQIDLITRAVSVPCTR